MTATRISSIGNTTPALYLAFELGWNDWKLAFATAPAGNPPCAPSVSGLDTSAFIEGLWGMIPP